MPAAPGIHVLPDDGAPARGGCRPAQCGGACSSWVEYPPAPAPPAPPLLLGLQPIALSISRDTATATVRVSSSRVCAAPSSHPNSSTLSHPVRGAGWDNHPQGPCLPPARPLPLMRARSFLGGSRHSLVRQRTGGVRSINIPSPRISRQLR